MSTLLPSYKDYQEMLFVVCPYRVCLLLYQLKIRIPSLYVYTHVLKIIIIMNISYKITQMYHGPFARKLIWVALYSLVDKYLRIRLLSNNILLKNVVLTYILWYGFYSANSMDSIITNYSGFPDWNCLHLSASVFESYLIKLVSFLCEFSPQVYSFCGIAAQMKKSNFSKEKKNHYKQIFHMFFFFKIYFTKHISFYIHVFSFLNVS